MSKITPDLTAQLYGGRLPVDEVFMYARACGMFTQKQQNDAYNAANKALNRLTAIRRNFKLNQLQKE